MPTGGESLRHTDIFHDGVAAIRCFKSAFCHGEALPSPLDIRATYSSTHAAFLTPQTYPCFRQHSFWPTEKLHLVLLNDRSRCRWGDCVDAGMVC
jgi:hypothetical protein